MNFSRKILSSFIRNYEKVLPGTRGKPERGVEREVLIAAQLRGVASTLDDVIESILGKDLITLVRNKKRDSFKQAPLYLFRLDL